MHNNFNTEIWKNKMFLSNSKNLKKNKKINNKKSLKKLNFLKDLHNKLRDLLLEKQLK